MKKEKILNLLMLPFSMGLMSISSGEKAPDFSAKNQNGKTISLSQLKGQHVLLFFYPKDDTPGCTKEACSFRDNYEKIKALNTVVLGISRQDEKSHQGFIAKHKLPFDLLVDSEGTIAKSFGVGSIPVVGFFKRKSVLIGIDGKVIRFYEDVNPDKHVEEVLADIAAAKGN